MCKAYAAEYAMRYSRICCRTMMRILETSIFSSSCPLKCAPSYMELKKCFQWLNQNGDRIIWIRAEPWGALKILIVYWDPDDRTTPVFMEVVEYSFADGNMAIRQMHCEFVDSYQPPIQFPTRESMRSMDDLLPVLMGLHDADPDLVPALIQAWLFPVDAYDMRMEAPWNTGAVLPWVILRVIVRHPQLTTPCACACGHLASAPLPYKVNHCEWVVGM